MKKKCEQAKTLDDLSNILLSTRPEFISTETVNLFLENNNRGIYWEDIRNFIQEAPAIVIDGNIIKQLIGKCDSYVLEDDDIEIFKELPSELYDEGFAEELLKKSGNYKSRYEIFQVIPQHTKTRELFESLILMGDRYEVNLLPQENIFEDITEEEFFTWRDTLVMSTFDDKNINIETWLCRINESLISDEICTFVAQKATQDNALGILGTMPKSKRTRRFYEILLKQNVDIIGKIPYENFDNTITQEEYDAWVEKIIIDRIKERKVDIFRREDIIPRNRVTSNIYNALFEVYNSLDEEHTRNIPFIVTTDMIPIYNRTMELYDKIMEKDPTSIEIYNIPCIDVDVSIDDVSENIKRLEHLSVAERDNYWSILRKKEEYKKWQGSLSDEEKEQYRKWHERKIIQYIEHGSVGIKRIPREAWTLEIWKAMIDHENSVSSILREIPVPHSEHDKEFFPTVILHAIEKVEGYTGVDILANVHKGYLTDEIISEAVKKGPQYLNYTSHER